MSDVTVAETCCCGATFRWSGDYAPTAALAEPAQPPAEEAAQ